MTTESFNQFTNRVEQAPPTTQSQIARLVFEAKQGGRRAAVARMALRSIPGGTEALIASTQPSPPPAPPRVSAPPPAPPAPIPVAAPPAPPAVPPSDPSLFDKTLGRGIGAVGRGVLGVGRFVQPAAMPVLENLGKAIETGVGTGVSTFGALTPGDFMGLESNLAEERAKRGIQTSLPRVLQGSPLFLLENALRGNLPKELQAQAAAWRATDMPSTTWNALPGQGIPLPGGKRLDEIDVGVKGAFELLPELGIGIATGGGSAAGGLARRTATSAANVFGADIAMLGAKGALGAGRAATRGAKAVIPSRSAARQADVAARGATRIDQLPVYEGEAWRAPSGFSLRSGDTAGDVVRYERDELGNVETFSNVTDDMLKELDQYPAEDIIWVGRDREVASLYDQGEGLDNVTQSVAGGQVIADIPDGTLVLKPETQRRAAKQADVAARATAGIAGPQTIKFIRNTERAPDLGTRFGQDVEPAGRYITEATDADIARVDPRFESGEITFENPLEIPFGEGYESANNWKRILSERYQATGEELSQKIADDGFDGIITTLPDGTTSEIVDLTSFKQAPKQLSFKFIDEPDISPVTGKPTVVDEAFEANQTKAVELPEGYGRSPGLIEDLIPKIVSPDVVRRAVEKSKAILRKVPRLGSDERFNASTLPGMAVSATIKAAAPRISSAANQLANDIRGQFTKVDAGGNRVFEFSADGMRIENIADKVSGSNPRLRKLNGQDTLLEPRPTIADLAQDYGAYEDFLTADQKAVMKHLRVRAEGLTADLGEFGFDLKNKTELGEGGFFISRGPTAQETKNFAKSEQRKARKEGFEKARIENHETGKPFTQAELLGVLDPNTGKLKGVSVPDPKTGELVVMPPQQYLPIWDEMGEWSSEIYESILDNQLGKFLLNYVDPITGERIALTTRELKGIELIVEAQALRAKIAAAKRRLGFQQVRLSEKQKVYVRAFKAFDTYTIKLSRLKDKLEKATTAAEVRDFIKLRNKEAKEAIAKAENTLDKRADELEIKTLHSSHLQDHVDSLVKFEEDQRKLLDNAAQRLEAIQLASVSTPRTREAISAARREVRDADRFVGRSKGLRERVEARLATARKREDAADVAEAEAAVNVKLVEKDWEWADEIFPEQMESSVKKAGDELKALRKFRDWRMQVNARRGEMEAAGKRSETERKRIAKSERNIVSFEKRLEKLNSDMEWNKTQRSKDRKLATDTGYRSIDNRVMFDELDLETIRRTRQGMKPLTGKGADALRLLGTYQSIRRAIGATLDDSGVSIQGKAGQFSHPRQFAAAYKSHLQSLIGKPGRKGKKLQRESMADSIREFDKKSQADGAPSSHEIIDRMGIRHGGVDTEVTLRPEGITGTIGKLPLIRRANEAFGAFGDMLRLQQARVEIMEYMRLSGKTFDELVADGTARKIGNGVNGITGWTPNGVAGVYGDMLLFAPRFFRARIETLHRATKGMDVDFMIDALPFDRQIRRNLNINHGIRNSIDADQLIARRAVMKMVSMGTLITVAANEVLGQETDFQLMRNGRMNPNFMSVRLTKLGAPRDWNIFGPYKSMAALMLASAGAGWEKEPQKALDAWLNLSSPIAGDIFEYMNFRQYGESRFGETLPEYIAESHIPFALQEVPNIIKETSIGNPKDAFGGGLSIGLELIGEQSSPLSRSDILQDHVGGLFRSGMVSADNYEDLEPYEKNDVKDSLVAELEKFEIESAATGKPLRRFFATVDIINRRRDSQLQEAMFFFYAGQRSDGGEYTKRDFIDDYFDIIDDARERKEQVEETLNIEWKDKVIADDDLEAQALEAWNEAPSKSLTPAGSYLPEKMKRLRDKVLRDYPQQADYIIRNTNDTPLPQGFLEALERAGLKSTVDRIKKSDAARQARGAPARAVVPSEALIPPEQPSGIQQPVGQPVVEDTPETVLRTRELLAP